jgi:flagellar hook-associated protein 2
MDIDALIQKMTSVSRERITKQEQSLQILEWKQTAYRSVTTALNEFRNKYFTSLSATNFKGSTMYNTIRATLPKDTTAFTATAQSGAAAGKAYVNKIEQLATSQSVTNVNAVTKKLEAEFTTSATGLNGFIGKDFMLTLDGVSRTIAMDSAFEEDLKRIAMADPGNSYYNASPSATDIATFNLNVVADTAKQAEYMQKALQNRVTSLFDNAGTAPADYSIKISVNSTDNGVIFETRPDSKLTFGYATQPAAVPEKIDGVPLTKAQYDALVKAAHNATGLGALGFKAGQSNKINIFSDSIADLQGKINGSFMEAGLDELGNQFVYKDADGKVHELTNSNFNFIINDVRFSIDPDESVSSLMSKINASTAGVTLSYSEVTDKFTLTSKTQGAGQNIVMGDTNRNLLAALGLQNSSFEVGVKFKDTGVVSTVTQSNSNADDVKAGKNAVAYIDGQRIERTSNEFTVNGVAYALKELYNESATIDPLNPADATKGAAVTLAPDTTDLMENIKSFVNDYNALVDLLYGLTNEEKFSDYAPLTETQKAAMSESEVKAWEAKAKSGLLRADSTVSKILSSMREAFLTASDGFTLFSMGITYGGLGENGKLKITDEAQMKAALEARPDQVRDFFTNASKGVAVKVDKIIDDAVRTTGGSGHRGSLIEMAGWPSTLSEKENSIYTQLLNQSKRIDSLKDLLEKEESRLWKQFSAMETALSKLNEQSSILTQYMGTGKS